MQIAKYELCLRAVTPVYLPPFAGSTLRGAFGGVFRRMVCVERIRTDATCRQADGAPRGDCRRCLVRGQCAYPYIFETWIESGEGARREVARPFVIEPPFEGGGGNAEGRRGKRETYAGGTFGSDGSAQASPYPSSSIPHAFSLNPGEEIRFGLNLFGRAVDYLPYFILTFREAGLHGLGRGRGRCELQVVEAIHPVSGERCAVYDCASDCLRNVDLSATASEVMAAAGVMTEPWLTVEFLTYTRLMYLDAWVDRVEFHVLISRLLRRLEALSEIHGGAPLPVNARELINRAKSIYLVAAEHCWEDWERYSHTQNVKIRMGGVLGRATYQADAPGDFSDYAPLLKLGELTHVGKGCVFGMGKIRVVG